ncbi:hypothetical protein O6H91_13G105300 [Diphasiastrum complanatum]|uniref:Uncharacterized protein n=1 Tax=Diphasiastrum complanatum TaxID=34168 RepID=A0ACC2BY79_DIPCM|nr:hypothetical protein O6H91_13G105300 [Diphasiastrum complanatum]
MAFRRSKQSLLGCLLAQTIKGGENISTVEFFEGTAAISSNLRRFPHFTSAVFPEESSLLKLFKSSLTQIPSPQTALVIPNQRYYSSRNLWHVRYPFTYEHRSCHVFPELVLQEVAVNRSNSLASSSISVENCQPVPFPVILQSGHFSSLLSSSITDKGLCESLVCVSVPPAHSSAFYFSRSKTVRAERGRGLDEIQEFQQGNVYSKQILDSISEDNIVQNPTTDIQDGKVISCCRAKNCAGHMNDSVAEGTGWTRQEVFNWPNGISMARLLSGPVLAWMVLQELPYLALGGMLLAGVSDWLDGYVARRMGIKSVLGSYLDPLADKVLVGSVAFSMAYAGLLHPALVALVLARDGALLVGAFLHRAHSLGWKWMGWGEFFRISSDGAAKIEPLYISKVNPDLIDVAKVPELPSRDQSEEDVYAFLHEEAMQSAGKYSPAADLTLCCASSA